MYNCILGKYYLNIFCSIVLISCLSIISITGCSNGDGGNSVKGFDENALDSDYIVSDFGADSKGFWVSRSNLSLWTFFNSEQPHALVAGVNFQELSTSRDNDEVNIGGNLSYYYHSDGSISISWSYGSIFGPRGGDHHHGIDYECDTGDLIIAPADGVVSDALFEDYDGNLLIISHTSSLRSIYAHLDSFLVSRGDKVKRGQGIALCGGTGGPPEMVPHLHFQVNRGSGWGESTDPRNYWYGGYGTPEVYEESKLYPAELTQLTHPFKPPPYRSFTGIISSDQELLILADTDLLDGVTRIMAGIKRVQGLDESVLTGEYVFTRIFSNGSDVVKSELLDFEFDGNGSLEYSDVQSDENINPSSIYDTYFISENEFDYTNLRTSNSGYGSVASDGNIFILSNKNSLSFGIGIKKSINRAVDELEGSYIVLTFVQDSVIATQRLECDFNNAGEYECRYISTPQNNDEIVPGKCIVEQDGIINCDHFLGGEGVINRNGDVFTLAKSNDAEGTSSFSIAIRKNDIAR